MTCCSWLYIRSNTIELPQYFVKIIRIIFYNLHRLKLFKPCLFRNLIFTIIGIIFQMPYIGDIPYITHFVSQKPEVPGDNIKCEEGSDITEVNKVVNGRSADIHAYKAFR